MIKRFLPALLLVAVAAGQSNDAGYTAKIRQYTTEPFFLTDLVDHLPASGQVPTPEKVLGYAIGTPGRLTYSTDIYRYLRELERYSRSVAPRRAARWCWPWFPTKPI